MVTDRRRHNKGTGRGRLSAGLLALTALIGWSSPASAEFRVCNKTKYLVNVAVGYQGDRDFQTEGWWSVTAASCVSPIKGALKNRFIYLYATDIDSNEIMQGTVSMCIDKRRFLITGITDCWRRGLLAVNFVEIDTLSAPSWTTILGEPGGRP
jgi:uncharacterized membrane protein